MSGTPEAPKQNNSILVQLCSSDEFNALVKSAEDRAQTITMDSWAVIPPNTPVLNYGAVPCLIMYVETPTSFVSGHFAITSKSRYQYLLREYSSDLEQMFVQNEEHSRNEIIVPDEEQIRHLTQWGAVEAKRSLESYEIMFKTIEDIITNQGTTNTFVHLFGQNLGWYFESYKEFMDQILASTIDRFYVDADIAELGIPASHINDRRAQELNFNYAGDDTIFIPETHTIFHTHESI